MSPKSETRRLKVWTVGRSERAEFIDACQLIADRADVETFGSVAKALASLSRGKSPDVVVLLQGFAGEHSRENVEEMSKQAPLSPVICLLGTYSEGETRSGRPLPHSHRLFWYNAPARLDVGFKSWQANMCPWWSLPTTVSSEEHWQQRAADHRYSTVSRPLAGRVAVFAARPDVAAPNMELLERCGFDPIFVAPNTSRPSALAKLDCGIWDAAAIGRSHPMSLVEAVKWAGTTPVISLRTFPRTQHLQADRSAGAVVVLPRLIGAGDLMWHVAQCMKCSAASHISLHEPAA